MNKRGYGVFGFVLLFLLLLVMWPFILAPMFTLAGQNAIANGATGIEAFLWTNINLWFFFALLIIIIIYIRFSGES